MRVAEVFVNKEKAGLLIQDDKGKFSFAYTKEWLANPQHPPVSLTLPKTLNLYRSDHLFPFFFHLLPEGANKEIICREYRIDPEDFFGLLLQVSTYDTIGKVGIRAVREAG